MRLFVILLACASLLFSSFSYQAGQRDHKYWFKPEFQSETIPLPPFKGKILQGEINESPDAVTLTGSFDQIKDWGPEATLFYSVVGQEYHYLEFQAITPGPLPNNYSYIEKVVDPPKDFIFTGKVTPSDNALRLDMEPQVAFWFFWYTASVLGSVLALVFLSSTFLSVFRKTNMRTRTKSLSIA